METDRFFGKKDKDVQIAVILMASGFGERYGKNKLLEEFFGKPLFAHALDRAAESGADNICVVTRFLEIQKYAEKEKTADVLWNLHPERGISESLRLGLAAQREMDGCCFMVCDQPLLKTGTLRRMFAAFRSAPSWIYVCGDGVRRGNPVLFPKDLFGELMDLTGDSGGRQILQKYPHRIREIRVGQREELYDIDSVKDRELLYTIKTKKYI